MELRLDDPKSKEDDMGIIIVDVSLMFRDATIKRGYVRIFLITEVRVQVKFFFLHPTKNFGTKASFPFLFTEISSKKEQGMDRDITSHFILIEIPILHS